MVGIFLFVKIDFIKEKKLSINIKVFFKFSGCDK